MNITLFDIWDRIKREPVLVLMLVPSLLTWLVGLGVHINPVAIATTNTFIAVITAAIVRGVVTPVATAQDHVAIQAALAEDDGYEDGYLAGHAEGRASALPPATCP